MNESADREPFNEAFVASWNESWGSNHFSVYVEDLATASVFELGDPGAQFPLASVVKVLIMAGTLEAVQDGRRSVESVSALLDRMIRFSDNGAAQVLWNQLGGAAAINTLAARWGLSATVASASRGFGGTLSVAADQVRLVKALVASDPSPLTDGELRLRARSLMSAVVPAQAWGVSAGVPPGWTVALKNGWWATTPSDLGPAGRWRVNSLGMVWDDTGAERWAIAVLGNTWPAFSTGVAAIEAIAARVAAVLSQPAVSVAVAWRPTPPVPSGAPGALVPVIPTRVLDTRADGSTLSAGATRSVDVSALAGPDATVAVAHLTADGARSAGYLTVFACGQPLPLASNVNYTPSGPVSNEAVVALAAGRMCVYSSAATDLIVDVAGVYNPTAGLRFVGASSPMRLLDTRATSPVVPAGSIVTVEALSLDGWPPHAVFANITVDAATNAGFLVAYPSDQPVPATSTLSYSPQRAIAAGATVATSPDGRFSVYTSAPVAIIVDLVGVFTQNPAGRRYQAAATQRVLDTRSGVGGWQWPLGVGQTITVPLALPAGSTAVGTLTALGATATGYITTWAGDDPRPPTSTLNVAAGDTIANLTLTRTAGDGTIAIYSQPGHHHLIYDLSGWYV
jgi:beta-lactamase class A